MDPTPLRFFSESYAPDFWREHDVLAGAGPSELLSVPRRGYPGLSGPDAMWHRPSEQNEARQCVHAHMLALTPPAAPDALMLASQNAAAFNEAYPAAEPLDHPVLTTALPVDILFEQLAHELMSIESASAAFADDYDTAREQLPPPRGQAAAFEAFMRVAEDRCVYDILRLETKYADLLLPLKGVTTYISALTDVMERGELQAPAALTPMLRRLLQACRKVRRQAEADLRHLETIYSRAAPIMREAASPSGQIGTPPHAMHGRFGAPCVSPAGPGPLGLVDDETIEILLHKLYALRCHAGASRALPNFFGPGTLHELSAAQVSAYGTLCGNTLTRLNDLRREKLGPVITEVRLAMSVCLSLLRHRLCAKKPPRP